MSKVAIQGNASGTGTITIAAPSTNSNYTITLPTESGDIAVFAAGTKMLFQQTSAPTGWTKDTTHDNKALRVVSGTASTGGSIAFTTAFASQAVSGSIGNTTAGGTVGGTTLTIAQIPSHNHGLEQGPYTGAGNYTPPGSNNVYGVNASTTYTGGGGSHDHSFTGSAHNHSFTGTAINLAVQYVDVIIATKD